MTDAGLIVLAVFISPFRSERRAARATMAPGEFVEVFIDTPLEVAEGRDEKGLYRKARSVNSKLHRRQFAYEKPETTGHPHRHHQDDNEAAAEHIVAELRRRGLLDRDRGEPLF